MSAISCLDTSYVEVQTYLKYHCNMGDAYERMKGISRGKTGITLENIREVIDGFDILEEHKNKLKSLTPQNYIGYFEN